MIRPAGSSARAVYRSEQARRRRFVAGSMAVIVAAALSGLAVGVPVVVAVAAASGGVVLVFAVSTSGRWRDVGRWSRGADGERLTAEVLDALPPRRWAVWHDLQVPGSRANIDHIVVGRTGVWVVDTKTTRAAVTSGWRSVRFGGRRLDTGIVRWEAEVVADRLEALIGGSLRRPLRVRPLVAVHGRGLRARGARAGGVRVIPAGELLRFIRRGRRRLARRDLSVVSAAVESGFESAGV